MSDPTVTAPGDDAPLPTAASLVVMARDANGGEVKTRLAATIGAASAATAYATLLDSTLRQVAAARVAWGAHGHALPRLVLARDDLGADTDPATDADPRPPTGPGAESNNGEWDLIPQVGADLGERLAGVFGRLFAEGSRAVVIVGSDSPALPPEHLLGALAYATDSEEAPTVAPDTPARLILGPAFDGGYYLVGLSRSSWLQERDAITAVLTQTATSTTTTFADTVAAATVAGVAVDVLPYWVDVDLAADLRIAGRLLDAGQRPSDPRQLAPSERERGAPLTSLREVYLHVTDRCGTGCAHCYNAGPASGPELSTAAWLDAVDQAVLLGATSVVLIGGDPFLRPDLLQIIEGISRHDGVRTRIFFNGPLDEAAARDLAIAGHGRLTPLLSIDGTRECNDALRGRGNYDGALNTAGTLLQAGLPPVINTVLLTPVLSTLVPMLDDLARVGARRMHLIFPHQRGGLGGGPGAHPGLVPSAVEMAAALDEFLPVAAARGIMVDNLTSWHSRRSSPRDLCGAGCTMLAIDPTGKVHACPITVGDPGFVAGSLTIDDLAAIWRRSPSLHLLRHSHARDRAECAACDVVDVCGGECWAQAHYAAQARGARMGYGAPFPYCDAIRPVLAAQGAARPAPGEAQGSVEAGCGFGADTRADLTPFECI